MGRQPRTVGAQPTQVDDPLDRTLRAGSSEVRGATRVTLLEVLRSQRVHQVIGRVHTTHCVAQARQVRDVASHRDAGTAVAVGVAGHRTDTVPGGDQSRTQVRADKPGGAGQKDGPAHPMVIPIPSLTFLASMID
jgi:hypothetical protein